MKNLLVFLVGALLGAAIVYFVCCKPSTEEMVNQPKGLITPAEASTLDKAFDTRHQLISTSIVGRPDNRSSWYSLSDVRDYLTYAENQAKDLGYTMNGIRVYLGAHADVGSEVGYTTMFLVPTGFSAKSEASMITLKNLKQLNNPDIPGGYGLNGGDPGQPPSANYPQ